MTKATAVKGMAAAKRASDAVGATPIMQPSSDATPIASAEASKAPRCGPPAKANFGHASRTTVPRPRQTIVQLQNAIADASGLPPEDAERFLNALRDVAARNLAQHGVFKLHNLGPMKMKRTPARQARTCSMFGKEVTVAAKPAGMKITMTAVDSLYDSVQAVES